MSIADASKQPPRCTTCSRVKLQSDALGWMCPNCDTSNTEKTGQTLIHLNPGQEGPMKWKIVKNGERVDTTPAPVTLAQSQPAQAAPPAPVAGAVVINVPVEIFPELVLWARKLKLPKNWAEATKLKAIVDFQVHLNSKLQELSK